MAGVSVAGGVNEAGGVAGVAVSTGAGAVSGAERPDAAGFSTGAGIGSGAESFADAGIVALGAGASKIDCGASAGLAIKASAKQVIMKSAPRIDVTLVRKLAVPRTLIKEPMPPDEPTPSPPPSERCSSTTPIKPTANKT
jgi:hypothetical protein